ncbi:heavy-metal-associated domain-containing protein [Prolixibacter denitrificans]|uniref:Copper chaperone CopZ n=1 Tax=Prolixibacter denitrificans TaxID=1541063 RepID=A0A2P8C8H6_9BACT|nr:heavy metal-associated domain-containing protein [Prolixibacter denitrificans]PSK81260.1 copper chaperone CopZ [Prolixibacter denitrificans]GET21656.1 hypothetical protein JCM18694_19020 [Prolixibacter denitrificans]
MKKSYQITGMTCEGCKKLVHDSLLKVDGVDQVDIDLESGQGTIDSKNIVQIAVLQRALSNTLYKISEAEDEAEETGETLSEQYRKLVIDYVTAIGRFDYDKLKNCLCPDFKFDGGLQTNSSNEYIDMLKEHSGSNKAGILRNEIKAIFIEGKEACVIYDMHTSKPVPPVTFMEQLVFENKKLKSTKMMFERPKMEKLIAAIQSS